MTRTLARPENHDGQPAANGRQQPLADGITGQAFRTDNTAFSRYFGVRPWAEGAFGRTYLAEDESGRTVLIKKLVLGNGDISPADKLEAIDNFEKEARILRNLDHESIPKYIDSFASEEDGKLSFFLVQQFTGKSLAQQSEERSFTEQEAITIGKQILSALVYLQSTSPPRLHRDISPQNITIDENGKAHLVDFGAAALKTRGTVTGTLIGTQGYAAPEQLMIGKAIPASDVYALGATLITLVSGKKTSELMGGDFKISFRSHATISDKFADVLQRMTERDTDKRFGNAREALNAFESIGNTELVLTRDIVRDALIKAGYGSEVVDRTLSERFGKASGDRVELVSRDMTELRSRFRARVKEAESSLKDLHRKIRAIHRKIRKEKELAVVLERITIDNRFATELVYSGEMNLNILDIEERNIGIRLRVEKKPTVSFHYNSDFKILYIYISNDVRAEIYQPGGWCAVESLSVVPGSLGWERKLDIHFKKNGEGFAWTSPSFNPQDSDSELEQLKDQLISLDFKPGHAEEGSANISIYNRDWYARVPFTDPLGVYVSTNGETYGDLSVGKYLEHEYRLMEKHPFLSQARISTIINMPAVAEELLEAVAQSLQEKIGNRRNILTQG